EPRQLLQKAKERLAVEFGKEVSDDSRRAFVGLVLELEPLLIAIEEGLVLPRRKVGEHRPQHFRIDEIVKDDVREGISVAILRPDRPAVLAAFVGIESNIVADSG
ncbi:MAG TPA: hypothetical protein VK474_05490, partial [Chthoniobacterales bacterium]|nr:hypothetical protein [Chthoniobacterales bacterium]